MIPEQKAMISGPVGQLEAKVRQGEGRIGLLMCHPHPLFQGTMDNKVVTTITRTAAKLGLPTLRFNFRGVGQSVGVHDNGQGEVDDVLAALSYARAELGWHQVILAGFSFGSGMACLAACQAPEQVHKLILVAPPVHHFAAPSQLPDGLPVKVLMGDADEVVPFAQVDHWAKIVRPEVEYQIFSGGSHFFHGRLLELEEAVKCFI